jgi:hypothetical protein
MSENTVRELTVDEKRMVEQQNEVMARRRAALEKPVPPKALSSLTSGVILRLPRSVQNLECDLEPSICARCAAPKRPEMACDDGWVEPHEGAGVSRCRFWQAQIEVSRFGCAALTDEQFQRDWDDLELTDTNWLAARALGEHIQDLIAQGLNIIFGGKVGTGKSHAAILICREAVAAGYSALRVHWPSFLDTIKDSYRDKSAEPEGKLIDRLVSADLLLIDDVGAGEKDAENDYSRARLDKVISRRYDLNRSTLVTVNFSITDFAAIFGDRASSRLRQNVMELRFNGKQYRNPVESKTTGDLVGQIWREVRQQTGGRE